MGVRYHNVTERVRYVGLNKESYDEEEEKQQWR